MSSLFESLKLRDVVLPNRIGMSPMCQYCAEGGMADDWHFVHYGSQSLGGAGLMVVEATAVSPEGRISPYDLGLWDDHQIEPLARIASFANKHGCVPALQLAHAGRKGSKSQNYDVKAQHAIRPGEGGWPVLGPSPIPQDENHETPSELSIEGINRIVNDFASATTRAYDAGFRVIELHGAHGYLLHQFLSPLSNQRTDHYGGDFENRIRFAREVIERVREKWPARLPLLLRISATDWIEGGWTVDEAVRFSAIARDLGVDLIDVSSGGVSPRAQIPVGPGYQTRFSARIREEVGIATATVGLITAAKQADHIVRTGQADMVMLGRELLRNRFWPAQAAAELGLTASWPAQYIRAAPPGSVVREVLAN